MTSDDVVTDEITSIKLNQKKSQMSFFIQTYQQKYQLKIKWNI